jgi:hypothetical protein
MKYDTEMGSVAMIYIPVFIKIDSNIQKLIGRDTQTNKYANRLIEWRSHKPTFIF